MRITPPDDGSGGPEGDARISTEIDTYGSRLRVRLWSAEAMAAFYELHPDTEVLSIMREQVTSEEILNVSALPCEDKLCQVRMDDARSVIEAVMHKDWKSAA